MADEPENFLSGMQRGIVAFEIPIDRLEGKQKMGQNRQPVDRERVVARLRAIGGEANLATAAIMARLLAAKQG